MRNLTLDEIHDLDAEAVARIACGYCPWCLAYVKEWPRLADLSDALLDTQTGHKSACDHKDVRFG